MCVYVRVRVCTCAHACDVFPEVCAMNREAWLLGNQRLRSGKLSVRSPPRTSSAHRFIQVTICGCGH